MVVESSIRKKSETIIKSFKNKASTALNNIENSYSALKYNLQQRYGGVKEIYEDQRFHYFESMVRHGIKPSLEKTSELFTNPKVISAVYDLIELFNGNKRSCNNDYASHPIRCLTVYKRIELSVGVKDNSGEKEKLLIIFHDLLEDYHLIGGENNERAYSLNYFREKYGEEILSKVELLSNNKSLYGSGERGYNRYLSKITNYSVQQARYKEKPLLFRVKFLDAADNIRTTIHLGFEAYLKTLKKSLFILQHYLEYLNKVNYYPDKVESSIIIFYIREIIHTIKWRLGIFINSSSTTLADYYDNYTTPLILMTYELSDVFERLMERLVYCNSQTIS